MRNVFALMCVAMLAVACGGEDEATEDPAPTQDERCQVAVQQVTSCTDEYCGSTSSAFCDCWAGGKDVVQDAAGVCSCSADPVDLKAVFCTGDLPETPTFKCPAWRAHLDEVGAACG